MTNEVEQRIVEMRFDNSQFDKNIRSSMNSLNELNNSLNKLDATKSVENLSKAANKIDLSNISNQAVLVKNAFSLLDVWTARFYNDTYNMVTKFANKIIGVFTNLPKQAIAQIKSGGWSRAMNLANAKFQLTGLKVDWNDIYGDIDYAVSGTAYGLDAAAKAASQLVASGVEFGATFGETGNSPMAKALRGISGVAAMTNSSFEDTARIFTTVAGQGRLMGDQLNQLAARGLNVAATLGEQLGKSEAEIRSMVSHGQIDFLTFSQAMDDAFGEHAKEGNKTFEGSLSNMKAALSRIGELFATPLMENAIPVFNQMRILFNDLKKAIVPFADTTANVMKIMSALIVKMIEGVDSFEAFSNIVHGVRNILGSIFMYLWTFGEAVAKVFGPVKDTTQQFRAFTTVLVPTEKQLNTIRNVFIMLLSPIKLIFNALGGLTNVLSVIIFFITAVVNKLVEAMSTISDVLSAIVSFIFTGNVIQTILKVILALILSIITVVAMVISSIIHLIDILANSQAVKDFGNALYNVFIIFSELAGGVITTVLVGITALIRALASIDPGKVINSIKSGFSSLLNILSIVITVIFNFVRTVGNKLLPIGKAVIEVIRNIGSALKPLVTSILNLFRKDTDGITFSLGTLKNAFSGILSSLGTFGERIKVVAQNISVAKVVVFAYVLMLLRLINTITNVFSKIGAIPLAINNLTSSFKQLVRAADRRSTLLGIAACIAAITVSLVILTTSVDFNKLKEAAVYLGLFTGAILIFVAINSAIAAIKPEATAAIAKSLSELALSILGISLALSILSEINFSSFKSFLYTMGTIIVMLSTLTASIILISKFSGQVMPSILSVTAMTLGLIIIAKAFEKVTTALINSGINISIAKNMLVTILAITAIFTGIISMSNVLKKSAKNVNVVNMAMVGVGLVIIGVASFLDKFKKIPLASESEFTARMISLISIMSSLSVFLFVILKLVEKITVRIGGLFMGIAACIAAFGAVAALTSKLPDMSVPLKIFGIVTLGVMALIAEVWLLEHFLGRNTISEDELLNPLEDLATILKAMGKLMISVAIAVGILAGVMLLVDKVDGKHFHKIFDTIGGILIGMGVFLLALTFVASRSKNVISLTGTILAMTAMIFTIISAIIALTLLPWNEVLFTTGIMMLVLLSLSILLDKMGKINFNEHTAKSIQAITHMIDMVILAMIGMTALTLFSGKMSPIIAVCVSMGLLFIMLGAAIAYMSDANIDDKSMKAISMLVGIVSIFIALLTALTVITGSGPVIVAAIAVTSAIVGMAIAVERLSGIKIDDSVIDSLLYLAGVMFAIGTVLLMTSLAFSRSSNTGIIGSIIAVILSIVAVAGTLKLLNKMKIDNSVIKTLEVMIALIGMIGIVFTIMAVAFAATPGAAIAGTIIGMVGVLAVLMLFFVVLEDIKIDNKTAATVLFMAAVILAIGIAIGIMVGLSKNTADALVAAIGMAAVLLALAGAIYIIQKSGIDAKVIVAISILVLSITLLSLGLALLAKHDWKGLLAAAGALSAVILVLGISMSLIKDVDSAALLSFAVLSASMILLAAGLSILGGMDWINLLVAAAALSIVVLAISAAMLILSGIKAIDMVAIALGLTMIVAAISGLGLVLSMFGSMSTESLVAIGIMAGILVIVIGALSIFIGLLAALNDICGVVVPVMLAMALVIATMAIPMLALGVLIKMAVAAIIELGNAMATLSERITDVEHFQAIFVAMALGIVQLAGGVAVLGLAIALFGITALVGAVGVTALAISITLLALAIGLLLIVIGAAALLAMVLVEAFAQMGDAIAETKIGQAITDIWNTVSGFVDDVKNLGSRMLEAGKNLIEGLLDGIHEKWEEGKDKVTEFCEGIWDKVTGFFDINSPSKKFEEIGEYLTEGMTNGINDPAQLRELMGSLTDMCESAWERVTEFFGIHSPSTLFAEIGGFLMQGLSNGISDNSGGVMDTLGNVGSGIVNTFSDFKNDIKNVGWDGAIHNALDKVQGVLDNFHLDGSSIIGQLAAIFNIGNFDPNVVAGHSWDMVTVSDDEGGGWKQIERWKAEGYESAAAWDEANDPVNKFIETIKDALGLGGINDMTDSLSEMTDVTDSLTGSVGGLGDAAGSTTKETDKLAESIESSIDIFSEFNDEVDLTSEKVLSNFKSELDGVSKWSDELSGLATKGISDALLNELADLGPNGYEKVHALYTMSESELSLFNKMYTEKLSIEKNTANKIRRSFKDAGVSIEGETEDLGEGISESIGDGIAENTEPIDDGFETVGREIEKDGQKIVEIGGGIPEDMCDAAADSVERNSLEVIQAIGAMAHDSMEAFEQYLNTKDAVTAVEEFQNAVKDQVAGGLNLFDEVAEEEEISTDKMLQNMRDNVKRVGKWARQLRELAAKGMDEGLIAELQALGPAGAAKVDAFARMSANELQKANSLFASATDLPDYVANKITKSYAQAGFETTLGFVDGIDPNAAKDVMAALAENSLDALKEALDIHSPSRKTQEIGVFTVMGINVGIEESLPILKDAGADISNIITSSIQLTDTDATNIAVGFMRVLSQALVNTMDSGSSGFEEVGDRIRRVVNDILQNSTNDINITPTISPVVDSRNAESVFGRLGSMIRSGVNAASSMTLAGKAGSNTARATDYTNLIRNIQDELHETRSDLRGIHNDISDLQNSFNVTLNLDGATVGRSIAPYVNQTLGSTYVNNSRRTMSASKYRSTIRTV